MLLQNWDGDVRDLHAIKPYYNVQLVHKATKKVKVIQLKEGMEFPLWVNDNYVIETLGLVTNGDK